MGRDNCAASFLLHRTSLYVTKHSGDILYKIIPQLIPILPIV
jgi:hypothetical protein